MVSVGAFQLNTIITIATVVGYFIGWWQIHGVTLPAIGNDKNTNEIKRRIVCFGDSTTWGFDPDTQKRLLNSRWPQILSDELNDKNNNLSGNGNIEYKVINEGLNGRTIDKMGTQESWVAEKNLSMNGTNQILPILYSHQPVDLVIIMLGINDCKKAYNNTFDTIKDGMYNMLTMIKDSTIWNDCVVDCPKRYVIYTLEILFLSCFVLFLILVL